MTSREKLVLTKAEEMAGRVNRHSVKECRKLSKSGIVIIIAGKEKQWI